MGASEIKSVIRFEYNIWNLDSVVQKNERIIVFVLQLFIIYHYDVNHHIIAGFFLSLYFMSTSLFQKFRAAAVTLNMLKYITKTRIHSWFVHCSPFSSNESFSICCYLQCVNRSFEMHLT